MKETLTFRAMTHNLALEMSFNEFDTDNEMPIKFDDDSRAQYFYLSKIQVEHLKKHLEICLKKLDERTGNQA